VWRSQAKQSQAKQKERAKGDAGRFSLDALQRRPAQRKLTALELISGSRSARGRVEAPAPAPGPSTRTRPPQKARF